MMPERLSARFPSIGIHSESRVLAEAEVDLSLVIRSRLATREQC